MWLRKFVSVILSFTMLAIMCNSSYIFAENTKTKIKPILCTVLLEPTTNTVLSSVNGDTSVQVGTAAKLMTVLLTAEAINEGRISLGDVKKTSVHANSVKGATIWLNVNEEMSIADLLKAAVIGNANDAAVSLAEAVSGTEQAFVKAMNAKALELGMKNTVFTNSHGFSGEQTSSATDMARLAAELCKYDFLREYFTTRMDYIRGENTQLVSTNTLLNNYDGIIGFKAGYSETAVFFVVAGAEREGETYIAIVLGSSDKDLYFTETKRLLNNGFSCYQLIKPELPEKIPVAIKVKDGVLSEVPLKIEPPKNNVIKNGTANTVETRVILPQYVYAPVLTGDKIGEIVYEQNGAVLQKVDIKAAADTKKINPFISFGILLKYVFAF